MLDVKPTAYIVPLAEQVLDDITPVIQVESTGDEDARVTGLVKIYRQSTDQLLYTSELATTLVSHGTTVNIAALSAWSPPAPADDDYFIMAEILAASYLPGPPMRAALGAWHFDVKAGPMGPAPAAHADTHQDGGMDEIDLTGLVPLDDYQLKSEKGMILGYPDLDAAALVPTVELGTGAPNGTKYLRDDQSWQVPPTDHARQHDVTDADDHTSAATPGQILQADTNGLPVDATNTDAEVAATVTTSHADEICDLPQTLTDQAAIDWDLALGGAAQVTLGGDRTLNAPTNMVAGARYRLKVIQDGTGTRLLTWNAIYRFPGGVHPCLSAAAGNIDILQFDCDGTYMDCVGMVNAQA